MLNTSCVKINKTFLFNLDDFKDSGFQFDNPVWKHLLPGQEKEIVVAISEYPG